MAKKKSKPVNVPWTEFQEADYLQAPDGKLIQVDPDTRVFKNSRYQVVTVDKKIDPFGTVRWLSIKRLDRAVIRDWRELQKIKNALAGPEVEAVEIFPAESRLVDTSNQFHSWAFVDGFSLLGELMKPGPKRKTLAERLWAKVDLSGGPESCWPFTGATMEKGYGKIAPGGDSTGMPALYAHKVAYCLAHGLEYEDIPPSIEVMHSCDNPPCCNPIHLSTGTSGDNKQDAISKNRMFWQRAKRDSFGQFVSDSDEKEDPEPALSMEGAFNLWCFVDGYQIPFGYAERLVIEEKGNDPLTKKSRQRRWDPEDRPADLARPDSKAHRQLIQRMR